MRREGRGIMGLMRGGAVVVFECFEYPGGGEEEV
jgi:hypothetical protein